MLTSISPLGERARGNRWWQTVWWLVLGAVLGGAALGAALGALGALGLALVGSSGRRRGGLACWPGRVLLPRPGI